MLSCSCPSASWAPPPELTYHLTRGTSLWGCDRPSVRWLVSSGQVMECLDHSVCVNTPYWLKPPCFSSRPEATSQVRCCGSRPFTQLCAPLRFSLTGAPWSAGTSRLVSTLRSCADRPVNGARGSNSASPISSSLRLVLDSRTSC